MLNDARARVPHAAVVELEGRDHFPFVGDVDALVSEIAAFVVGERRLPPPQRLLSAVLFTDLIGSTKRAAELGDENWKSVLDRHDARVRTIVGRCGGSVIKTTGDGVLALLPSAGVCLRAAAEVRRDLGAVGLDVRIGVHVGDIDRRGDDVSGLAVNIASRAMSKGGAGDIVVTVSVVAAVAGQAVAFEPLGTHELKGVPGAWQLFRRDARPLRWFKRGSRDDGVRGGRYGRSEHRLRLAIQLRAVHRGDAGVPVGVDRHQGSGTRIEQPEPRAAR